MSDMVIGFLVHVEFSGTILSIFQSVIIGCAKLIKLRIQALQTPTDMPIRVRENTFFGKCKAQLVEDMRNTFK